MKNIIPGVLILLALVITTHAREQLIFEDDFDREESQEEKEELGNGWTTSSDARANGNKQADLRDGTLHIYIHQSADHAVSVRQEMMFENGKIELRMMLEGEKDSLGLNIADMKCKEVHAGHLAMIKIGATGITLTDMKTGKMSKKIRDMKKSGPLPDNISKLLRSKEKKFSNKLKSGKWYNLEVEFEKETLTVEIDGDEIASFSSQGFAHTTKSLLRLSVPRQAVVDDIKIYAQK